MHDILKKLSGKERRGGDSFASLLFVVAAFVFSVGTFALTDALMGSRDTTLSFVPMSATTYLHSDGYAATETLMSSSAEMPAGIHPYEFALFTSPGDDTQQRGIILAWTLLRMPSATELTILKDRGASQLDARHYFLGDASLATAVKVSAAARVSLAYDATKSRALKAMRELFNVQAIANPRDFAGTVDFPLVSDIVTDMSPETTVLGASVREHSFVARVTPLSVPVAHSISRGTIEGAAPKHVAADFAITEPFPDFNLAKLLPFAAAANSGVTMDVLAESDLALASALHSPFELWVRGVSELRTRPVFLMHFPRVELKRAAEALIRHYAVRNPSSQNLMLPDGDIAAELVIDAALDANSQPKGDVMIGNDGEKVVVGSDGADGSLLSTDPSMIAEFRRPSAAHLPENDPCGRFSSKITVYNLASLQTKIPSFSFLASKTGIDTVSLSTSVGNELFFCGYKK